VSSPSNPSFYSGHHVAAGTGGGGNAKSAEGGCGSGAQGSRDAIAEGCGGADAEGPGASSGLGGADAEAEDFGRSGACAGAEDFGRSGSCGCIWLRQLLQWGRRRLLWQWWTEPHSAMDVSVFGSFNMVILDVTQFLAYLI